MKKIILSCIIASFFTTTHAYSNSNKDEVITVNFGLIENIDNKADENIYGISYFQAKGKNQLGLAYNLDFFKTKDEYLDIDIETFLFAPSVGFSLGLTDELYLVPSAGLSYVKSEASLGEISADESEWGFNVGSDLVYKLNNGITFGLGAKYTNIDEDDFIQFQGKIGWAW